MDKIRVLLIEDNRLLRKGATRILNEQSGITAIAASGSDDHLKIVRDNKPDLVLVDSSLQGIASSQLIRTLGKEFPKLPIVVMALIRVRTELEEFVRAGATGFILKDAPLDEFIQAVRSLARGEEVLPIALPTSLFSHIVIQAEQNGKSSDIEQSVRMTRREQEVTALVARGLTNKEIAAELNLSVDTVKSHVHNILDKLALHSRLGLARYALGEGREHGPKSI